MVEGSKVIVASYFLPWISQAKSYTCPNAPSSKFHHSHEVEVYMQGDSPSCTDLASLAAAASPMNGTLSQPASPTTNAHPDWQFLSRRGHSAMFSGIRALKQSRSILQIGWTGRIFDATEAAIAFDEMPDDLKASLPIALKEAKQCVPVFLDKSTAVGHYEGYCKSTLWPLLHYIIWETASNGEEDRKNWRKYCEANETFAKTIVENYEEGDLIWIHDYHLLLAPSYIRKALPNAQIGLFLHTPFPSSEFLRCLPKRSEILAGMLGANLIGFQTYACARHFISSCTRALGCDSTPTGVNFKGNLSTIGIFPVGIDPSRVLRKMKTQPVRDKMASIREMYANKKIIIGRDKLDHIKGVEHKLSAFAKFLTLYPEWENNVVLIQVTTPPQRESPKLEAKVSELVSRINGSFGSLEFAPVHHYHQHLDQDEYYALLGVADIGLITSVRDGMNTTSQEYVIAQAENKGPLILSEFTGIASSMGHAMMVNPWDYTGVANVIHEALTLSDEDKALKHKTLYSHVTKHTAEYWATSFVKELANTAVLEDQSSPTPVLDAVKLKADYEAASRRLFMFDYDGTLTSIRKIPSEAVPSEKMLKALTALVEDKKNLVYVISGRDQDFLDKWLGHIPGLGLSAEHGCFLKHPGQEWMNLSAELDLSWKTEVTEIFDYYTERTTGSFVEHKICSVTWHYRMADPDYGAFQAKECQNHLENAVVNKLPIEILRGKKNLEVRPCFINKGSIVKRLTAAMTASTTNGRVRTDETYGFIFCAGDDKTDEDMFKVLLRYPGSNYACTIGPSTKKTLAQYHLPHPDDMIDFISQLAFGS